MSFAKESSLAPKLRGLCWLALAATFAAVVLQKLPAIVLGHVSRAQETRLGNALPAVDLGPRCAGTADLGPRALRTLIQRIYPLNKDDSAQPIQVTVVQNPAVNALTGLGGHVVVFSGLLNAVQTPEELAGILAHEFEHVHRRHVLKSMANDLAFGPLMILLVGGSQVGGMAMRLADYWVNLQFSRSQEAQADAGALVRLKKAKVSTAGLVAFFARQQAQDGTVPSWLNDHPGDADREAAAQAVAGLTVGDILPAADWLALKQMCGAEEAP